MNQKNVFTIISAILLLQGLSFYFMAGKVNSDTFPNLNEAGNFAAVKYLEVVSVICILVSLISYSVRFSPQVLWAYTVGFGLFTLNTLKHLVIEHINVPMIALVIQGGIALACGYLWMQNSKQPA